MSLKTNDCSKTHFNQKYNFNNTCWAFLIFPGFFWENLGNLIKWLPHPSNYFIQLQSNSLLSTIVLIVELIDLKFYF